MLSQNVRFTSFLQLCSIPLYKCTIAFLSSFTDGYFNCFQTLSTTNNSALNIGVHIFFIISFGFSFCFLYILPEVEILGHKVVSIFNFLRKFNIAFHSGCTDLHSILTNGALGFPFLHGLASTCRLFLY